MCFVLGINRNRACQTVEVHHGDRPSAMPSPWQFNREGLSTPLQHLCLALECFAVWGAVAGVAVVWRWWLN